MYGLPKLPTHLGIDDSVPVAFWVGPTTAAVLCIRRLLHNDPNDDDDDDVTDVDVTVYHRIGDSWQIGASGGGAWLHRDGAGVRYVPDPGEPFARVPGSPRRADLDGWIGGSGDGRAGGALYGEIGDEAAFITVEQAGVSTRAPVVAPTGIAVVSFDGATPAVIRITDAAGELLAELMEPAMADSSGDGSSSGVHW